MKFKELYEKGLDRKVNPAVSASDLSEETVTTEIGEYVFTKEIINNLYKVLTNIKTNQGNHIGIWVNGYYGSGKSHFLKYASYCMSAQYAEKAFDRLIQAAREMDLLETIDMTQLTNLRNWYVEKAHIEMIMFNIGEVDDSNADRQTAFTKIFWNKFNAKRGYNSFNLPLAQCLEKALDHSGKFEEFKEYVKSKGYDWESNLDLFSTAMLDEALKMAKEVVPSLTIDAIRERVINNDVNVSVESFAKELKEYIDSKQDKNYRILFFVDEVSQFIGKNPYLLLQLQSLVELLYEKCESKVWIACTAQQSLEEVVSDLGGKPTDPNDEIGKILGRFEVRASLQGTSPEYITRRRILEKNGSAEIELGKMYQANKSRLDAQFILPTTYQSYNNKEDFIGYYPFVPYQFQLIMRVLDSFVSMNYVDRQVKGNERSMLNITFSIAKETAEFEVGEFIPFDRFFGAMFQGSMQYLGRRAIANAQQAVDNIKDEQKRAFYRRVMYILFMICNLADQDKPSFSATIDNVVTLLMTKVDANRGAIKNDVERVLLYLMDNSVIRKEKTRSGTEIYEFYTEEETKVAEIIKNQRVDNDTYSEELYKIINEHLGLSNKETYATRSFNIGCNVNGRHYLSNNADVVVDFLTSSTVDIPEQYLLNNSSDHLVFFLTQKWNENADLRQKFLHYCRVQVYASQPANSASLQEIKKKFQDRARQEYDKDIKPMLQQILDTCSIISGQSVLSTTEVGISKGRERYKKVIECHMEQLYKFAKVVESLEVPKNQNDLKSKITRPIEPSLVEKLSVAEQNMMGYLERQSHDVTVEEVVKNFAKVPYGWSDFASIYILNELVRRHLYAYAYNNAPNVQCEFVAQNIVKEASKFTIEKAKVISQDILNNFIEAWKKIFNEMSVPGGNDPTGLYRACNESEDSVLRKRHKEYNALLRKLGDKPFVEKMKEAVELMEKWLAIKDHKKFFETIIEANTNANTANIFDYCKKIASFVGDHYDKYEEIVRFVNDNQDNFSFIPEQLSAIDNIKAIKEEEEPWEKMPSYIKLKHELDSELQTTKSNLVENIKTNYNKLFDELDSYANSVGVAAEKYANREQTIAQKIGTNNFHALRDAAEVAAFRDGQYAKINSAIETSGQPSDVTIRKRKAITISTQTTAPLRTEEDVDAYLQRLKAEIMQHIGGNEDIIIN